MKKQGKVIMFPFNKDPILDTKRNLEQSGNALIKAIERIAGHDAVDALKPLITTYRVACDLNGFAEGINYMEERNRRHQNNLATN